MTGARRASGLCVALIAATIASLTAPASALDTTARSGPVELRVSVSPEAPRIGDPVVLDVEAVAEPGVELLMPDFGEALDRFRIVDFVPRERSDDQGRTVASQRYTLQVPASGEHRIPSILVEFVDRRPGHDPAPQGQDAYELLSEAIAFTVESVVPDSAKAELSPPLGRLGPLGAGSDSPWPWLAGLALVLGAVGPLVWRAIRRAREKAAVRSAWEIARGELDALLASPHPGPDAVDAYFVSLSGIVRRYLEDRFAVRSPELTTERFIDLVSGSPDLSDDHQALLRDFLTQCDLVKFAHAIPSREAVRQAVAAAERFIDETRDAAAAEEAAA